MTVPLLTHGHRLAGPALVESEQTTILVAAGWHMTVDKFNNAVLGGGYRAMKVRITEYLEIDLEQGIMVLQSLRASTHRSSRELQKGCLVAEKTPW